MSSNLIPPWSTTSMPTSTTIRSVATTAAPHLLKLLKSAYSKALTATSQGELVSLSRVARGAGVSLTLILAEQELATATGSAKSEASQVAFNATLALLDLEWDENTYDIRKLNRAANIIYLVVFVMIFAFFIGMLWKSRYHWFNVCFTCGYGLEFGGFAARVASFGDMTALDPFIAQLVMLTIAPAFIMGGIYFLFAQLVVIHGRNYSLLRPLWYSYIFITCDVLSLIIQAGGGGSASVASQNYEDTDPGTYTMIAGIAFQVFAMSIFLIFWFDFLRRMYFHDLPMSEKALLEVSDEHGNIPRCVAMYNKKTVLNYIKLLLNVPSAREFKTLYLEKNYNPGFAELRERRLFHWFPLFLTLGVIFIYIRCVYRVVELSMGFNGYLITHEVYLMTLDALMIALNGIIFCFFHPTFVFGVTNVVQLKKIKQNIDEKHYDDYYEEGPIQEDSASRLENSFETSTGYVKNTNNYPSSG